MSTPSRTPPESILKLFKAAAELKATGHAWPTIAARLNCPERTLRRRRDEYPDCWGRLLFEACEEVFQRVAGMALTNLSGLVNNKEHPQQWRGCQFVYGKWIDVMVRVMKFQCRQPPAA